MAFYSSITVIVLLLLVFYSSIIVIVLLLLGKFTHFVTLSRDLTSDSRQQLYVKFTLYYFIVHILL